MNDNIGEVKNILTHESSSNEEELLIDADKAKMRHFIIHTLRDKEVLIVLDNCEDPLEDDGELFCKQLDTILDT